MIKLNIKIWGMPVLIFLLFTILVGILSAITPNFSNSATGFDEIKDSCIGITIGAAFIVMLWVLVLRYKKFGVQLGNMATVLLYVLTTVGMVSIVATLIKLLIMFSDVGLGK